MTVAADSGMAAGSEAGLPPVAPDQPEMRDTPVAEPMTEGWRQWASESQQDAVAPPEAPRPAIAADPVASAAVETARAPAGAVEQAAPPREPAASDAPRRRSTVREPAPVAITVDRWEPVQSAPADEAGKEPAEPSYARVAQPAASDVDVAPREAQVAEPEVETAAEDPSAPRRTGWWAKRVFGKG